MKPPLSRVIPRVRPGTGLVTRLCPTRPRFWQRQQHTAPQENSLPRLAQPSIWHSIIPRALRNRSSASDQKGKKPINPATYFIWIYLLIGSQAIRIMAIKTESVAFNRKADLKIQKLREVIEKLQRGEEVDVEKVLGTGDELQEQEWEEALRELQEEDRLWQSNRQKSREEKDRLAKEEQDANPVNDAQAHSTPIDKETSSLPQPSTPRSPGFY